MQINRTITFGVIAFSRMGTQKVSFWSVYLVIDQLPVYHLATDTAPLSKHFTTIGLLVMELLHLKTWEYSVSPS